LNKVRKSHLRDAYPVRYEDRKIDGMQFRPLPSAISDISGNSRPSNREHTCEDTEPKREVM